MSILDDLKVEEMLAVKNIKMSSGEIISGKDYLEGAIIAFDLKPCDYFTAFNLLRLIGNGNNADAIVEDIKAFWQWFETKYEIKRP